jgi:hypothetical protein
LGVQRSRCTGDIHVGQQLGVALHRADEVGGYALMREFMFDLEQDGSVVFQPRIGCAERAPEDKLDGLDAMASLVDECPGKFVDDASTRRNAIMARLTATGARLTASVAAVCLDRLRPLRAGECLVDKDCRPDQVCRNDECVEPIRDPPPAAEPLGP